MPTTASFKDLGLGADVLQAIAETGYTVPTPIQVQAIPTILMNRDVLACAQTGTGKTASFALPLIEILSHGRTRARMPRALILVPTRELAAQVAENFVLYGRHHKLSMALLIGGLPFGEQEQQIARGADVLVATPGRLLDHCERGTVLLNDSRILIIDEADRMLDMGFVPDVERIVQMLPSMRQTLMFSATIAPEVRKLADRFLRNPREITVDPPSSTAETVIQAMAYVTPRRKLTVLKSWLDAEDVTNGLIFCNRKRDIATVQRSLNQSGYGAGPLHGDMDQYKRMEWLGKFRDGLIRFLVCSDVAARGLDIPRVSHVFNYDVPTHPEDYVHRIGRTGRAGQAGVARMLATEDDQKYLAAIVQLIGQAIPVLPGFEQDKAASGAAPETKAAEKPTAKAERTAVTAKPAPKAQPQDQPQRRAPLQRGSAPSGKEERPFGETEFVPAFLLKPSSA